MKIGDKVVVVEQECTLIESIFDLNKDEQYFLINDTGCYTPLVNRTDSYIWLLFRAQNLYRTKPEQNPNEFTYTGDVEALAKWMGHPEGDVEWWIHNNADQFKHGCKVVRVVTPGNHDIFKVKS